MNQNQLRSLKRGDKVVITVSSLVDNGSSLELLTSDSRTTTVTKVYRGIEPYIRVKAHGAKIYAENVVCKKV